MLTKSESINELMAAVVRAQQALLPAKKDASNPFYKSKYADLPAVWEALAPFRTEGIAIIQSPAEAEALQYHSVLEVADKDKCERDDRTICQVALETILVHAASGQWISSRLVVPLAKNDPQGAGSALTYARRYALGCMTGLVTEEDDDGNAASHGPRKTQPVGQDHKVAPTPVPTPRPAMTPSPMPSSAKGLPPVVPPADLDAAWLSDVLDCETVLRDSQQGTGTLKAIRNGFRLQDGTYPMLPEDKAEYRVTLQQAVKRLEEKA